MTDRAVSLARNHRLMFIARALLNIRMFNVVLSLFYLSRGVTLSQIFYVNICWAIATLLFEIPSSYLADYWGRKKTLILGAVFGLLQWIIFFFGNGFIWMSLGIACYGLFYACFSGTDTALMYDTEKELGREQKTLRALGRYESAQHVIKIIAPLVAAYIAHDLLAWQFRTLVAVDMVATVVALVVLFRLTEPHHRMDVEHMEAGIIVDAVRLLKRTKGMFTLMVNREVIFLATLLPYLSLQTFLVGRGLPVFALGIGYACFALAIFLWNWSLGSRASHRHSAEYIDRFNVFFFCVAVMTLIGVYSNIHPVWLLVCLQVLFFAESARTVYFKEVFHKQFHSFNRATTASLTNMLHNIVQIPTFFAVGLLVGIDARLVYVCIVALAFVAVLFARVATFSHIR